MDIIIFENQNEIRNYNYVYYDFSLTKVITMNLLWLDIQFGEFPSHQEVWEVQEYEEQSISGTGQQSTDNLIIFIQTVVFDGLKFNRKKKWFC